MARPVSASFGLADLYPEAKGPIPSTYQLANPHEAAAAEQHTGRVLTGPPLNLRELLEAPATWVVAALIALVALGMRK